MLPKKYADLNIYIYGNCVNFFFYMGVFNDIIRLVKIPFYVVKYVKNLIFIATDVIFAIFDECWKIIFTILDAIFTILDKNGKFIFATPFFNDCQIYTTYNKKYIIYYKKSKITINKYTNKVHIKNNY